MRKKKPATPAFSCVRPAARTYLEVKVLYSSDRGRVIRTARVTWATENVEEAEVKALA